MYDPGKLEAVPSNRGDEHWLVRPVHPDGAGYAAITVALPRDVALLFVASPALLAAAKAIDAAFPATLHRNGAQRAALAAIKEAIAEID